MTKENSNTDESAAAAAVQAVEFPTLADAPSKQARPALPDLAATTGSAANPLHGIRAQLTVSLGTIDITVGELLSAKEQQVLRLDRAIEELVDVLLQGQVVARGTLVAVGDSFGVRITELPRALTT